MTTKPVTEYERLEIAGKRDSELLKDCLSLLMYVTYHDGRYGQDESLKFQNAAQAMSLRLAKRLGLHVPGTYEIRCAPVLPITREEQKPWT